MKKVVFFGSNDDVLDQMYKDVSIRNDVLYKKGMLNLHCVVLRICFFIYFSRKINKFIKLPFKEKWFNYFIPNNITLSNSVNFIFTKDNFRYLEQGYAIFLKRKYPNSKIILLFLDVHGLRGYNFEAISGLYDTAFVFDKSEAEAHSISYYPLCYSRSKFENEDKIYDICFIGKNKGRIDKIYKIYNESKDKNLIMKVIICGEKDLSLKKKYPEFEFVNSIPYHEAVEIISKSKYNLEICLEDTSSISIRLYEAIIFNQGLITNNADIVSSEYYDESFVKIIDFQKLDLTFAKEKEEFNNEHLKNEISPLKLIEYILKSKKVY